MFWKLYIFTLCLAGPGRTSAAVGGTDAGEQTGKGGVSAEERRAHPTAGARETHSTPGERAAGGIPHSSHAGDQCTGVCIVALHCRLTLVYEL